MFLSNALNPNPVSIHKTPLENRLLQKLKHSLEGVVDPEIAKNRLYEYGEVYKNYKGTSPEIENFLYACRHKTLHESVDNYFSSQSYKFEAQPNLVKNCVEVLPLLKPALTAERETIGDYIRKQFPWVPIRRHEMLRLLIHTNQIKGSLFDKPPVHCHVLDIDELKEYLAKLNQKPLGNNTHRLQLIICNEVHYTAVDLELSKEKKQCCILDAYREEKAGLIEKGLLEAGYKLFVAGRNAEGADQQLQTDTRSCSIYSLSQLTSSSWQKDFFHQLSHLHADRKDNAFNIAWDQLSPPLIKNSQNELQKIDYLKNNPTTLWKEKPVSVYLSDAKGIENKLTGYIQKINVLFAEKTAEELVEISCQSPLRALERLSLD